MADSQKKLTILPDNPLCGINTYKDTLNLATGACTRQIKSIVIPSDYSVITATAITNGTRFELTGILGDNALPNQGICTHAVYSTGWNTFNAFSIARINGHIYMARTDISTVEEFRAWLAAQYANGTPVTVWYALATPEETTVTVPSGLSGTEEGYLNQSGTPTPTNPVYPTANEVLIWEHSLRKLTTATEAVENPLYSDGTAITSYTIKGNTVQNGTPSPSNPVAVNGVGVRTENLTTVYRPNTSSSGGLNFEAIGDKLRIYGTASTYVQCINTNDIILPSGTYTFSISSSIGNTGFYAQFRSVDGTTTYATITNTTTITFNEATTGRIRVIISATESKSYATDEVISIMINEGSTAKPYEPYGYKIPISSANTTTPVYLGEVETERKIKKQILTGTESVLYNGNEPSNRIMVVTLPTNEAGTNTPSNVIGTHFETKNTVVQTSSGGIAMRSNSIDFVIGIGYDVINVDSGSTPLQVQNAFKTYLQQQYAAGTPVTIWYVLATPETAAVNEPLMKIGDYADTLSNATAIPTTEGANSITVDTTVQPSEFTATWTGWHDASVKEWDGSDWS